MLLIANPPQIVTNEKAMSWIFMRCFVFAGLLLLLCPLFTWFKKISQNVAGQRRKKKHISGVGGVDNTEINK
jgi:hypothetical protein